MVRKPPRPDRFPPLLLFLIIYAAPRCRFLDHFRYIRFNLGPFKAYSTPLAHFQRKPIFVFDLS